MKITEDTKIKDLIPEGYEFNPEFSMEYFKSSCNVTIPVKKKEVKDFKWYVKKYSGYDPDKIPSGVCGVYNPKSNTPMSNYNELMSSRYHHVPFEFKIGLLKFICDDLGFNMLDYVHGLYVSRIENIAVTNAIKSICPAEFLNSIFK